MGKPTGKKITSHIIGCIGAVFVILVVLILAVSIYSYLTYRQNRKISSDDSQSLVIISEPDNLSQFPAGSAIRIEVNAGGLQPFLSTEFWINGAMASFQAIPAAGQTSITTNFWWTPPEDGFYSLVGRAIDEKGQITTSPAVIVFINPVDYKNQPDPEAGKVQKAVYPIPPAEYTIPQSPAAGETVAPGEEWQGSPGEWLNHLTEKEGPAAPKLVASTDGCDVHLDINDLSDNEEGFTVYRQTTDSQEWVHVTDLASHPGEGWIGFQDHNLSGGVTYYVSAYNSQGEGSSNLALVNVDAQACPPTVPLIEIPALHLKVENLNVDEKTGGIYCYTSLDSKHWSRWPEFGLITSEESGEGIPPLINPLLASSLSDEGVELEIKTRELNMECWSWQGSDLVAIGNIKEKIDMAAPREIHLVLSGADFDVIPKISLDMKSTALNLGVFGQGLSIRVIDQYSVETLGYVPESEQMPDIIVYETDDPSICQDHILGGDVEKLYYCAPLPGFTAGPGGSYPQKYLVWYLLSTCKGYPEKECFSLDWWENFAKYNPAAYDSGVKFMVSNRMTYGDIYDLPVDTNQYAWRVHPDMPQTGDPTGEDKCIGHYRWYKVYLDAKTSLGEIRSSPSNWFTVPCPEPYGDTVDVEVNFYSLTLDNINDGYNTDLTEDTTADYVHGLFGSVPSGKPAGIRMGYAADLSYWCDDLWYMGGYGCTSFGDGANLLENIRLCRTEGSLSECLDDSEFNFNNNKIIVTLRDQDSLQLFVHLTEFDDVSPYDTVCDSQVWLGPWPLNNWAALKDEPVWLTMGDNGDASCAVEVILNAHKPDQ